MTLGFPFKKHHDLGYFESSNVDFFRSCKRKPDDSEVTRESTNATNATNPGQIARCHKVVNYDTINP